jgi:hypothetical protein
MINPNFKEKLQMCLNCKNFTGIKCSLISCTNCFNNIINSKFGRCPENKWKIEINLDLEKT